MTAEFDRALEELIGDPKNPVSTPVHREMACLGCGAVDLYHPGVGFPCCLPCLKRLGNMTWDERIAIHSKRKTIEQVLDDRGRQHGSVADRVHVPEMFALAKASGEIADWSINAKKPLVIWGPTGTGKTYQAVGAMRSYLAQHRGDGYLINCAGLSRMSRDDFHVYARTAILALDDLGARLTPTCLAAVYELIDYRIGRLLPLIVTTNLFPESLVPIDERISSRLMLATWIRMTGEDRRLQP